MNKAIQKRITRTRHDPSMVRRLLSEREESGESFIDLESRSGIPASTLSSSSRRFKRRSSERPGFVEVVATSTADEPDHETSDTRFELLISAADGVRRLLVPLRFDAADLQRLVRVLEATC